MKHCSNSERYFSNLFSMMKGVGVEVISAPLCVCSCVHVLLINVRQHLLFVYVLAHFSFSQSVFCPCF